MERVRTCPLALAVPVTARLLDIDYKHESISARV